MSIDLTRSEILEREEQVESRPESVKDRGQDMEELINDDAVFGVWR